jgi:hypothetical protein
VVDIQDYFLTMNGGPNSIIGRAVVVCYMSWLLWYLWK